MTNYKRILSLIIAFSFFISYATPVMANIPTQNMETTAAPISQNTTSTINITPTIQEEPAQYTEPISEDIAAQNHVLVQMDQGVDADTLVGAYGLTSHQIQEKGNLAIITIPNGDDPAEFSNKLMGEDGVHTAGPDYFYELLEYDSTPNDPGYTDPIRGWWQRENGLNLAPLWESLNNTEYGPRATGDEIVVAVLDSGFYLNHQDKAPNIVPMKDEVESAYFDSKLGYIITTDNDVTPTPTTVSGSTLSAASHGTMVASQISAAANNNIGVIGASYDTKVLIYKVGGKYYDSPTDTTPSWQILDQAVVQGIDDAIADGADIISMSFGGPVYSILLQNAINRAHAAGVMVVASTGNDGGENKVWYPAACKNVIAVGSYEYSSTLNKKVRALHTNYGIGADPENAGVNNNQLDILAPGVSIYGPYGENGYSNWTGTSMAAPAFAAVAALIWRFNPNLSVDEITNVLLSTADSDGVGQPSLTHGWGYVNPMAAYNKLKSNSPSVVGPVITAPTATASSSANVSWTSINEAGVSYNVYVNNVLKVSKTASTSMLVNIIPNQSNDIKVIVNSRANWYKASTVTILSDMVAPTISSLSYLDGTISWSHNERAGFTQEYNLDNIGWNSVVGTSVSPSLALGNHSVVLRITDAVGNITTRTLNFNVISELSTTMSASSTSFKYSGAITLSGSLRDGNGNPLSDKRVILTRRLTATGADYALATVSTDINGNWTYYYNPPSTWERNQFITASYSGLVNAYSASVATAPLKALVILPTPKKSVSAPRVKKTFTISGYIKPKFKASTYPVKALIYKKNSNGTYSLVKSVNMKAANYLTYSKLSGSTSLASKGSYKICFRYTEGVKAANGYYYGTTYSPYHYFSVK